MSLAVGQRVRKKDGTNFRNGYEVVTIEKISIDRLGEKRAWFKESGSNMTLSKVVPANNLNEAEEL